TAVELLNRILRVDAGHIPTLERLVATYTRLNEETNILASMNSLAEAHIAKARYAQAATVLEKLIQREPQNAQHRNKLQFVKSQTGGADTLPPRGKPEAPPPLMEIEEPVPTIESLEEEPSISLEMDTSPPIELDLGGFSSTPTAAPRTHLAPAVEIAADQEAAESGDDLDFITEHLTEAEVFAKYGLAEKAAEHLRAIIDRSPKHLAAHEKLYRILLDEGDNDGARTAANQYVALLEEKGDSDAIAVVKNEFSSRGQPFAAAAPSRRPPSLERPAPKVEPAEEEFILEVEPELEVAPPPAEDLIVEEEISFEEEAPAITEEPGLTFDTSTELSLGEEPSAEEPFFGVEAVSSPEPEVVEEPSAEELSEIDALIAQEQLKDAGEKLDALSIRFPFHADLTKRRKRLDTAVAAAEAIAAAARAKAAKPAPKPAPAPKAAPPPPPKAAPPPPKPPALSRREIESELLSAIPDDDGLTAAPAPPPPPASTAPPPPPPPAMTKAQEENLFADEDNFFDLAAELESELVEEAGEQIALSEEEQSLEEIFKEFKKGVEQQLDSEDYDTHYNLGIAYKEMGLIDEAIGEFQLASKDAKRAVECASMLGLCFLEKGMPQLAIKWYRKGLEIPEIKEEEHLGLLYDLGSAYVDVGDTDSAQKAFMEVYGLNTNYRDIVTRIKQLENARK
ncbi:MAG TPA: tetratricopeptide repeat protein, partial [Thermoanaerobaculia bacterium]